MFEAQSKLGLNFCSSPCDTCPVGGLSPEKRNAVDVVYQQHYPELEGDELPYDKLDEWAAKALWGDKWMQGATSEIQLVASAVEKIANGDCRNYTEE